MLELLAAVVAVVAEENQATLLSAAVLVMGEVVAAVVAEENQATPARPPHHS